MTGKIKKLSNNFTISIHYTKNSFWNTVGFRYGLKVIQTKLSSYKI
jgi:hypothetical protein